MRSEVIKAINQIRYGKPKTSPLLIVLEVTWGAVLVFAFIYFLLNFP